MKKVLIVNTATTSLSNGISNVAFMYAKSISNIYCIDLVMAGKVIEDDLKKIGSVFRKVYRAKHSRVKHFLSYAKWLTTIIQENCYDIIHVHGNSATMFLEINVAKRCGVSVRVCHCHSTSCKFKLAHYVFKAPLNRQLTSAVACSKAAGQWLYTKHFTILNNGIDSKEYAYDERTRNQYRNGLGLDNSFVIGHVGYLSDEKNQRFIIDIAELLNQRMDGFKILLIGDGNLQSELEQEVQRRSLSDKVIFLGRRNDVSKIYSAMDVFIFPSKFEGFGLALIEAQACGLACIASNQVPIETKINKNTMYLELENQEQWLETLIDKYLTQRKNDRNQESQSSISIIKKKGYDAASNREKLIDIYEGIV